ncbi:UNVERIFIED_CONTAM: hypothetical protein K2H54_004626 [Gekko kuhli]
MPGPSCKGRNDTPVFGVVPPPVQSNGNGIIGLLVVIGAVIAGGPRPGIVTGVPGPVGMPVVVIGVTGAVVTRAMVTGADAERVGAMVIKNIKFVLLLHYA